MKPQPTSNQASLGDEQMVSVNLLGTPQLITSYEDLLTKLAIWSLKPAPTAVEFCNTQVVAMRRIDPTFINATSAYDFFIPDGMPLIWCLRTMGIPIKDRVYGPTFMRYALCHEFRLKHYFMGGTAHTLEKLVEQSRVLSDGRFQLSGATYRYWEPGDSPAIIEEINRLSPDVIWIGLGTPKQQQWIRDNKHLIARGVLLTVGFAFDVNAGTKRDAPLWMQKLGITWVFRISQEPSRLLGRYLKYNTCFILLCLFDLTRFAWAKMKKQVRDCFSWR